MTHNLTLECLGAFKCQPQLMSSYELNFFSLRKKYPFLIFCEYFHTSNIKSNDCFTHIRFLMEENIHIFINLNPNNEYILS